MADSITFPVGRIMQGSVNKLNPVIDRKTGIPKTYQKGVNVGQPRYDCFFATAIAKKPGETHFAQTEWGAKLWAIGHTAYPKHAQGRDFSWKIIDGDSSEPDKNGIAPNQREGWPGHWIVKFNNSKIPRLGKIDNGRFVDLLDPNYIRPGYFVEVVAEVKGNGPDSESPGIYVSHQLVCFRFFGEELTYGPDPDSVGFGNSVAPPGASTAPLASTALPGAAPGIPPAPGAAPGIPPAPGAAPGIPPAPGAAPGIPPAPGAAPGIPPAPGAAPGIPPAPGAAPGIPPAPAVPVKTMTAKAGAYTYEQYIASGYTDAQLIEQGFMVLQ